MFYALVSTNHLGESCSKVNACESKRERDGLIDRVNSDARAHASYTRHDNGIWYGRYTKYDSAQAITAKDARKLTRDKTEYDFWSYEGMTVCDL